MIDVTIRHTVNGVEYDVIDKDGWWHVEKDGKSIFLGRFSQEELRDINKAVTAAKIAAQPSIAHPGVANPERGTP